MDDYVAVRRLLSPDKQWRGDIFRRPNGTFGFWVFKHHDEDVVGPHWDLFSKHSEAVVATVDDAERELRGRIPELATALSAAV